jgi:receptor protein-tyrosine kinase
LTIHLPPSSNQQETCSGQEWSAIECARALYRRKATLAWITGACILAAALISALQPRLFQSEAALEFQGVNENFLNLRDINPTPAPLADASGIYIQTQSEKLQDQGLMEQVARRLRLAARPEFRNTPMPEQSAADAVKRGLKIVPGRGSRIVRVVCDASSPQLAADVANTLAATFIEQDIEARQRAARQTRDALNIQLADLRRKVDRSEADSRIPSRASADAVAARKFYESMSQKASEAGVAAAMRQSDIRLISPARPATRPYKPNLPLNLGLGAAGGLILALGYVMLHEQTNSRLRAPGEAGTWLTLPELGVIPKALPGYLEAPRFPGANMSALEHPPSRMSEPFRATLASILSAGPGEHPHILLVTSSRPNEGKTTVVSNLGIALAEISGKVLLIDGDMRRPRLHKVFDQANSWGLSDVLLEKNAIEELPLDVLVRKTAVPHLYLLPSGASTGNIFSLLCSARMSRLMPRFRQEFDYVLVDAPPCLEFTDARIMARYAEKLLLVVRSNYTERRTAQAAVQRLLLDGISVMGVILNHWNPADSDTYGYGRYDGLNSQGVA